MVAPIPAKRGRKPAVATAPADWTGSVLNAWPEITGVDCRIQWQCGTHRAGATAGLPNSTTHRLLTTMQQQGFVRQVGELGHGQSAHMPLWSAAAFSRAVIC